MGHFQDIRSVASCAVLAHFAGKFLIQNLSRKCEREMDKDVIEKCLAFCQALSSSNQLFSFNLKIGSDSFNFDMKELAKSSCVKKKSPSQLRREKRKRDERKRAATMAEED